MLRIESLNGNSDENGNGNDGQSVFAFLALTNIVITPILLA